MGNSSIVSQGQSLVFVTQRNGRLVAPWGDELVMLDSIKMIPGIRPGVSVEVEILEVEVGNGTILTARPTEATQRALQAAGNWPSMMVLELCFRAKNGGGVYAIEPATGKRVYPAKGCRGVWVNAPCDYLCTEQGRVIVAWPVKEPTGHVERDPNDPNSVYTYQEAVRRQQPNRRGRRDNRDRGARHDRWPQQTQKAPPATVVVTFERNTVPGKDGVVAFDETNFGKRPIFARRGATVPIGRTIEVRAQVHGGIVLAEPVKSAEDFRAEFGVEVELYTVPVSTERSADDRPAQLKQSESPTSPAEKFRQKHGDVCAEDLLAASPVAPQAPDKKGQPAAPQALSFAEKLRAATRPRGSGQSSKGE